MRSKRPEDSEAEMQFTRSKLTFGTKPRVDRWCKNGLFGFLAVLGACFLTPLLFGFLGLAFLSPYLDRYALVPLIIICFLLVLYGWIRGGKIIRHD